MEARAWLWQEEEPAIRTLGGMRQKLARQGKQMADLDEIEAGCSQLGYAMRVSWTRQSGTASYDAIFMRADRQTEIDESRLARSFLLPTVPVGAHGQSYTNQPLAGRQVQQLVPYLRQCLQERLPDYMIPARFVLLDHMPLTLSGKVDRIALYELEDEAHLTPEVAYVAPRTPIEEQLAEIRMQMLGLSQVGVYDDS